MKDPERLARRMAQLLPLRIPLLFESFVFVHVNLNNALPSIPAPTTEAQGSTKMVIVAALKAHKLPRGKIKLV
jgi:hypothetical protein